MKTILFDTVKNIPIGDIREGYYLINGERAKLPPNIIELEVEYTLRPTDTSEPVFVRYGGKYVQCWVENGTAGWHDSNRNIRVTFFKNIWANLLMQKVQATEMQNATGINPAPEITTLFTLLQSVSDHLVIEDECVHIYLEELYPEHKEMIESIGGIITVK